MRNIFSKLTQSFGRFMYVRYGTDELNRFLLIVALIMIFLSYFPHMGMLSLMAYIPLVWSLFRSFSKKIHKRRLELVSYIKLKKAVIGRASLVRQMWINRKTHKYFKCKKCGNIFRVPKGKGKIEVTCPKCRDKSIRKS